jgi:transposase InsO family protein
MFHADRGSSMRSKPVAFLLADLSITKTHRRPYTSNDNPYSESQFRTMKYRPEFPDRSAAANSDVSAVELSQPFLSVQQGQVLSRAVLREVRFIAYYRGHHDQRRNGSE